MIIKCVGVNLLFTTNWSKWCNWYTVMCWPSLTLSSGHSCLQMPGCFLLWFTAEFLFNCVLRQREQPYPRFVPSLVVAHIQRLMGAGMQRPGSLILIQDISEMSSKCQSSPRGRLRTLCLASVSQFTFSFSQSCPYSFIGVAPEIPSPHPQSPLALKSPSQNLSPGEHNLQPGLKSRLWRGGKWKSMKIKVQAQAQDTFSQSY